MQPDIILPFIKLVLGGIAAFSAILLWSKTRDAAWSALITGVILSYAGVVYDILELFGISAKHSLIPEIAGINLIRLFFTVIPQFFVILGLIIAFIRKRP